MLEIASQMILCLLLAALLGFIIGYLFGKMTCANDDCGHNTDLDESHTPQGIVSTTAKPTSNTSATVAGLTTGVIASTLTKPALLSAPRDGKADNLSRIKGVDAKLEEELNNSGIYHYDQIAKWDNDNIQWADETLGSPGRVQREEWVPQAKILATAQTTKLSKTIDDEEANASNKSKPSLLSTPRDGKADNLSRIKGVGAKLEEALNKAGIYHFDQIAAWTSDNISWADDTLGFPGRADRENWVEQSKILAAGEETEFSKRVDAGEVKSSKES